MRRRRTTRIGFLAASLLVTIVLGAAGPWAPAATAASKFMNRLNERAAKEYRGKLKTAEAARFTHVVHDITPVSFQTSVPCATDEFVGGYRVVFNADETRELLAALDLERWTVADLPSYAVPCWERTRRQDDLSLELIRGRDTIVVQPDLERGTITISATDGRPVLRATIGRHSAELLHALAVAVPEDTLLLGIEPCDSDTVRAGMVMGRDDVSWLEPGDPIPMAVHQVAPEYPQPAVDARLEGTVGIQVLVNSKGRVAEMVIANSVPGLDEAAARALEQWTFTAAVSGGHPVAAWTWIPVKFSFK